MTDSANTHGSMTAESSVNMDDSAKVDNPANVDDSATMDNPANMDNMTTMDNSAELDRRRLKREKKLAKQRAKQEMEENVIVTAPALKYKDYYVKAFDGIVQPDADFVSGLPTETIHNIFSYLILDHDPERGIKSAARGRDSDAHPHVLISLAAMSRRFHGLVESFGFSHLLRFHHGPSWKFRTDAERAEDAAKRSRNSANSAPRRSSRLAGKPRESTPSRIYRMELVRNLQIYCIECDRYCVRRAPMANGVACCTGKCEEAFFPDQINLTDAIKLYDLRDYMLLKSRTPGPRAKHTNLPTILYGSAYIAMGYRMGWGVTYKFFRKDVVTIAHLVHGDIPAHMQKKHDERIQRKVKRLRNLHVELKITYHTRRLEEAEMNKWKEATEHHQIMLDKYKDPQWDGKVPKNMRYHEGYFTNHDEKWEVHDRVCQIDPCDDCADEREERAFNRRYNWY